MNKNIFITLLISFCWMQLSAYDVAAISKSFDATFINETPLTVEVNSSVVCEGQLATVTATPSTVGNYNYEWTVPGGVENPGSEPSFTTQVEGTYTVTISTIEEPICSSSASGTVEITPLPTVIVSSLSVCEGATATLEATLGVAGNYNYEWTVPDGVVNPGDVSSFTTQVAGTYSVTISTIGETICSSEPSSGIVTTLLIPTVIVEDVSICFGESATIAAIPGDLNTNYNYDWTVSEGVTDPGDVSSFTTQVAGTYSVVISTVGEPSCSSESVSGIVTITEIPTATLSDATICLGQTATITAIAGGASPYDYMWTVPSDANNPGNVASFSTSTGGEYILTISSIEAPQCEIYLSCNVIVSPLPSAGMILGADAHCSGINGDTLFVAGNIVGNLQWYSSIDENSFDLIVGETYDSLAVYNLLNTTYFTVIAETEGCVPDTSEFVFIPINDNDMISYLPESIEMCEGSTEYLFADNLYTTSWFVNGAETSSSSSFFNFNADQVGNNEVSNLSRDNIGCAIADTVIILVNPSPEQVVVEMLTPGLLGFNGTTIYDISWGVTSAATGIEISESSESNYNYYNYFDLLNNYYWVEFTNEFGCSKRSYYNEPLSIIEVEDSFIGCYPNPAAETLFIACDEFNGNFVKYEVFDLLGRQNLSGVLSSNISVIDVSMLKPGYYLLNLGLPEKITTMRFAIR